MKLARNAACCDEAMGAAAHDAFVAREGGAKGGAPVVLVARTSRATVAGVGALFDQLARSRRVIVIGLRRRLLTPPRVGRAGHLERLLDEVRGLERVHLVALEDAGRDVVCAALDAPGSVRTLTLLRTRGATRLQRVRAGALGAASLFGLVDCEPPVESLLGLVRVPTLLVESAAASKDRAGFVDLARRHLQTCQIAEAGHAPHAHEIAAALVHFFESARPALRVLHGGAQVRGHGHDRASERISRRFMGRRRNADVR